MVNRNPGRRREQPDEPVLSFAEAERGRADGCEAGRTGRRTAPDQSPQANTIFTDLNSLEGRPAGGPENPGPGTEPRTGEATGNNRGKPQEKKR